MAYPRYQAAREGRHHGKESPSSQSLAMSRLGHPTSHRPQREQGLPPVLPLQVEGGRRLLLPRRKVMNILLAFGKAKSVPEGMKVHRPLRLPPLTKLYIQSKVKSLPVSRVRLAIPERPSGISSIGNVMKKACLTGDKSPTSLVEYLQNV